jgi:predicted RecB family nuclease
MRRRITNAIFADYFKCQYKAYLKFSGKTGRKSTFQVMQEEISEEYKASTSFFLEHTWSGEKIISDLTLSRFQKYSYTRGINIKDKSERFEVLFDCIIKDSKSNKYLIPVLFTNKENLAINDKLNLAFCGFALGLAVGEIPSFGRIIHGAEHSNIRVKLDKLIARVRPVVERIESFHNDNDLPQLHINKHCQVCEFEDDCMNTALKNDDLSLISGLGSKKIDRLHNKGIFTVNQLSFTFKPRRKKKSKRPKLNSFNPALKALALRENKVYVFEEPQMPTSDIEIFLDIESIPDRDFYYLIGVLINEKGTISEHSFWADQQDQQSDIFLDLLGVLNRYEDYLIYHYGLFEKRYLKRMFRQLEKSDTKNAEAIVDKCCNVLSFFYSNVYTPTFSNGLKDIARFLNFKWRTEYASGIQSIIWRIQWEKNRSCQIKNDLLNYNMDDCHALRKVKEFISSISESKDLTHQYNAEIVFQSQLKGNSPFKFLNGDFANDSIESIHKFSLFDYQRQRVFVRTDDLIKKSEKRRIRKKKSALSPNKTINYTARICVRCKSRNIFSIKPISKNIIDLKFTSSGIKRWITKLTSYLYQCRKCGLIFSPERFKMGLDKIVPKGCRKNRSKYGHNIKSWTVYQHIVNNLSFRKIESDLYEFFGLAVSKSTLHELKYYIHRYYGPTYEILLRKLLRSDVLYIDETPLKMKNENGYAWVLTNNREIVSIYKPTREGDFLKGLLEDFNGILVSDFYAAYDSIDCTQQKCLIHLIRDMNDDLLKNPFNEELKFITHNFTDLMQKIVRTIDRYGLKKYHLHKYSKDVESLLKKIAEFRPKTEIGLYYQERFNRNRDKLFVFIHHDNVSWNNNNAEKAIKLLATHTNRKIKLFSESRMREYLVIMSVYQTCVYNNISFLKFLLSKERDIERYIKSNLSFRTKI